MNRRFRSKPNQPPQKKQHWRRGGGNDIQPEVRQSPPYHPANHHNSPHKMPPTMTPQGLFFHSMIFLRVWKVRVSSTLAMVSLTRWRVRPNLRRDAGAVGLAVTAARIWLATPSVCWPRSMLCLCCALRSALSRPAWNASHMICQLSQESPELCVGGFGSAIHRHRTIVLGQMPPYFDVTLIDAMVIGSTPMGLEVGSAQCNGWAGPALDAEQEETVEEWPHAKTATVPTEASTASRI